MLPSPQASVHPPPHCGLCSARSVLTGLRASRHSDLNGLEWLGPLGLCRVNDLGWTCPLFLGGCDQIKVGGPTLGFES